MVVRAWRSGAFLGRGISFRMGSRLNYRHGIGGRSQRTTTAAANSFPYSGYEKGLSSTEDHLNFVVLLESFFVAAWNTHTLWPVAELPTMYGIKGHLEKVGLGVNGMLGDKTLARARLSWIATLLD